MVKDTKKSEFEEIDGTLDSYVDTKQVPGFAALIDDGMGVHTHCGGHLAFEGGDPIQRDSIFRISSMTKPITAVAALTLVQEGRIGFEDPVGRWLPELANRRVLRRVDGPIDDTVQASRSITLKDLLTFCMGSGLLMVPPGTYPIQKAISERELGDGPPQPQLPPHPDEWMRRFAELPLMVQPGSKWLYNTSFEVLGVLISRLAGRKFEEFLEERIFEPLGMSDTSFYVPESKLHRFATAYANWGTQGQMVYDPAAGGQWSQPPAFPSGAAGLVSTIDDYHSFAAMLLNKGEFRNKRILSEELIRQMTKDQLSPSQKANASLSPGFFDSNGFGYGVSVVTKEVVPYRPGGQYSWDGGLGTAWIADPKKSLVAVLLTQQAWDSPNPPPICDDFFRLIYEALEND